MNPRSSRSLFLSLALAGGIAAACSNTESASPVTPDAGSVQDAASPSYATELRALLEIEDQRLMGDARLQAYLASPVPEVASRAAEVAGQVRDAALVPVLEELLKSAPEARVRASAAEALQWFDAAAVRPALHAAAQTETNPIVLRGIFYAFGTVGNDDSAALMSKALEAPKPAQDIVMGAATGLALMIRTAGSGTAYKMVSDAAFEVLFGCMSDANSALRVHCAGAVRDLMRGPDNRFAAAHGARVLAAWSSYTDPTVRLLLSGLMGKLATPASLTMARDVALNDPSPAVRATMCAVFPEADSSAETMSVLAAQLADKDVHVATAAVEALSARVEGAKTKLPEITAAYNSTASAWLRSLLFVLLQKVDADGATARADAAVASNVDLLVAEALKDVAKRNPATHMQTFLDLSKSPNIVLRAAAYAAISDIVPEAVLDVPGAKAAAVAGFHSGHRDEVAWAMSCAKVRNWPEMIPEVAAAIRAAKPEEMEVVSYGLYVLGKMKATAELALVDSYLESDLPWIGDAAAVAHKEIAGDDVSARVRKSLRVTEPTPSDADIAAALAGEVEFETSRGVARMKFSPVNPVGAAKYAATVKAGALDGIRMHRDIAAFVGQFGDPSFGGSGNTPMLTRTYRTSRFEFEPGTFAIARGYIDDDSSQLFYNRAWNLGLTQNYTPMGVISSGMSVMDALEYGDTFVHVRFVAGN